MHHKTINKLVMLPSELGRRCRDTFTSLKKTCRKLGVSFEEKGSDVNLALNLLNDAWLNLYDCAVIVSNDSDLAESLRLVKNQHKKMIGLITPNKTHPSKELMQYADFNKRIRKGVLAASQLPDPIPGTTIRKPSAW